MSTNLESNIILNTQLTQPKGKGFESLHNQLQKIERKLERLTQRDWKIKVTLDDSGLSSANLKIVDQIKGATKAAKDAMSAMQESLKAPMSSSGFVTKYGTNKKVTKNGIVETSRQTEEGASRGFLTTRKTKYDSSGNIKEIDENLVDIAAKEAANKQKEQEKWYGKMRAKSQKLSEQINANEVDQRIKARDADEAAAKKKYGTSLKFNSRIMEEQANQTAADAKKSEAAAQKKYKTNLKFNSQVLADQERQQELDAASAERAGQKKYKTALKFNSQVMEEQRRLAEAEAANADAAERKKFSTKVKFNSRVMAEQQNAADAAAKKKAAADAKEIADTQKKYKTNLKFNSQVLADQERQQELDAASAERAGQKKYKTALKFNSQVMEEQRRLAEAEAANADAAERKKFSTKVKFNSRVMAEQQNAADAAAKKKAAADAKEIADTQKKYKTILKFNSQVMADQERQREAAAKSEENASRRGYKTNLKFNSRVMAEQENAAFQQSNRDTVGHMANELPSHGFQRRESSHTFNSKTGQLEEIQKFQRVTGNILKGYQVEIVNANVATGKFTHQVLEGAAASRALGDSMLHAITKVAMWSAATGTVFATIQALRGATAAVIELEQSTVLLARVGQGLTGDFEERYKAAKRLSRGIVEMTAVYGGNSEAAVKAASVFARAGQNEVQILESVRASLLASRIAELDVVEAAELMSSAIYQFGGDVSQMIPTIDMLNTLSNQYRVTTDDLLQSISRSGSIFAQQNGRMSELAAVTAVTASVTSRSGAEIGNAIKTIASQIDRVETKRYLLEKLGITVHDIGGESKSYTEFLLDMSLALNTASDAERNLATTQTAGVRQRNVLLAQMKNVIEIIKAENKALIGTDEDRKYGSAGTEFQQTSRTMESTLQRLRAQSILATAELGGGFLEVGKDMADLLTGMLKYISSGNEATNGMLAQVAVVGALAVALKMLASSYGVSISSVSAFVSELSKLAMSGKWGIDSMKELSMQLLRTAGSAIVSLGAFAALALAITVLIDVSAQYARQLQLTKEIEQSRQQIIDREINTQKNRSTAYRNSTEKIVAMRLALEKLNEEEAKGGVDRSEEKATIEKGIKEISETAGLPYQAGQTAEQAAAAGYAAELDASKKEAALRQQKLIELRKAQAERNRQMELEKKIIEQGEIVRQRQAASKGGGPFGMGKNEKDLFYPDMKLDSKVEEFRRRIRGEDRFGENEIDAISRLRKSAAFSAAPASTIKTEILASVAALEKLRAESGSSAEAVAKLTEEINELNRVQAVLVAKEREVIGWKKTLGGFSETADQSSQYRAAATESNSLFGGNERELVLGQYDEVKKELEGVYDAYVKLREAKIIDADQAQDAERKVVAALEEEKKLYMQLQQIWTRGARAENNTITNDDSKMRQGQVRIALQKQRGLSSGNSSFLDPVAEIEINRRAIIEDNNALFSEADSISSGSGTAAEKSLAIESIKVKIAENLVQLRSLEGDKALSILEAEKNIAIERKKSADEALRALGVLSREGKARVMAQAMFFNKNPGKKISAEQQFLMSSEDNQIGRQFFNGNYENLSESNSNMAKFLNRAGFGMTNDITDGQKELTKFKNGRTSPQLAADARANQLALGQQQARLNGDAGQMNANVHRDGNGGIPANVVAPQMKDIHVQHRFDFSGVATELQRVYQIEATAAAAEVAKELKTYVDKKLALSKLPPPKVANGQ